MEVVEGAEARNVPVQEARAEDPRLLVRLPRKLRSRDPPREAQVVADHRTRSGLTPDGGALDHDRLETLRRAVHGSSEAPGAGADDGDVEAGGARPRRDPAARSIFGADRDLIGRCVLQRAPLVEEATHGPMEGLVATLQGLREMIVDTTARDGRADGVGGPGVAPVLRRDQQRSRVYVQALGPHHSGWSEPSGRRLLEDQKTRKVSDALVGGMQPLQDGQRLNG